MTTADYVREVESSFILDASNIRPPGTVLEQLDVKKTPAELKEILKGCPEIQEYGRKILERIKAEGYCIVRDFPFQGYEPAAQKNLFLMLICACGEPSDHMPGKGEYICKVHPRDNLKREIETYSEHNLEAPLHTDSHYRESPEEFAAFLMEHKAEAGGRNILLRIDSILSEMRVTEEGRRWLKYLKEHSFPSAVPSRYSDTLGQTAKYVEAPIINPSETAIRFREDTIRKGIVLANRPRDEEQDQALDFFTTLIYRSPERRGVTLENGEILFVNNYTALHARTAFEDRSRVLLRIRFNETVRR